MSSSNQGNGRRKETYNLLTDLVADKLAKMTTDEKKKEETRRPLDRDVPSSSSGPPSSPVRPRLAPSSESHIKLALMLATRKNEEQDKRPISPIRRVYRGPVVEGAKMPSGPPVVVGLDGNRDVLLDQLRAIKERSKARMESRRIKRQEHQDQMNSTLPDLLVELPDVSDDFAPRSRARSNANPDLKEWSRRQRVEKLRALKLRLQQERELKKSEKAAIAALTDKLEGAGIDGKKDDGDDQQGPSQSFKIKKDFKF